MGAKGEGGEGGEDKKRGERKVIELIWLARARRRSCSDELGKLLGGGGAVVEEIMYVLSRWAGINLI